MIIKKFLTITILLLFIACKLQAMDDGSLDEGMEWPPSIIGKDIIQ